MSITQGRPDFAAHAIAVRAAFPVVIIELGAVLGARLVPYLGAVGETRAVRESGRGDAQAQHRGSEPPQSCAPVALPLAETEPPQIAQAWFQGLNPQLDDRSPAWLLREAELGKSARPCSPPPARF